MKPDPPILDPGCTASEPGAPAAITVSAVSTRALVGYCADRGIGVECADLQALL